MDLTTLDLATVEALSFDCYGTLIDWEAGLLAVLAPWSRGHGLDMADEALLVAYADLEATAEAENPGMSYPDILARTFRALGLRLGVPVRAEDAQRLARSVPDWPAFEDSPAALAALAAHYRLIILSNVDRASFEASNARLGVTFDLVLTAQDIGSYKPSPRNFEALVAGAADLGVPDGRLLHVAQSLFHDHVPAKHAGLPTVWVDRRQGRAGSGATPLPGVEVTPDLTVTSMAELAAAAQAART